MFFNIHSHKHSQSDFQITQYDLQGDKPLFYSSGIHPWDAQEFELNSKFLESISHPNCLAIGEIGLDKNKGPEIQQQESVFQRQITLSESHKLPVIIHCVRAWNEIKRLKRILQPKQPWIFHGFSKVSILEDVINEGLYVSFGEAILRNSKLLEASTFVPLEKLFLETDDSNIAIETIYSEFASAKKITLHELQEIQLNNFKRVFSKWKNG